MARCADNFVDHYSILNCSPETSASDLKHAYHEQLREFHPDKRPGTSEGMGRKVTQALNEAWEALRHPALREAYDYTWRQNQRVASDKRADVCRCEGNALYKEAQNILKDRGGDTEQMCLWMSAVHKYQAAIALYSEGIVLAPLNHRLWSNRALCYAALKQWPQCQEDSFHVTQLMPTFMKGWFLLAKSLWKEGSPVEARKKLEMALRLIPNNAELQALYNEIGGELEPASSDGGITLPPLGQGRGSASRNVSPCLTPATSRTPSRSPGPSSRRPTRTHSRSPGPVSQLSAPSTMDSQSPESPPTRLCATNRCVPTKGMAGRPLSPRQRSKSPAAVMPRNVAAAFACLGAEEDDDNERSLLQ